MPLQFAGFMNGPEGMTALFHRGILPDQPAWGPSIQILVLLLLQMK